MTPKSRTLIVTVLAATEHEAAEVILEVYGPTALFIEPLYGEGPWTYRVTLDQTTEEQTN